MKGIYYIKNYIDEIHTSISGYFVTEDEAREGLTKCSNWFRPNGTGEIWFQEFGINGKQTLIFEHN